MNTEFPLTLANFESWLKTKNEQDVVGIKDDCKDCPIFRCLQDKGEKVVAVGCYDTEFLRESYRRLENPIWVRSFVLQIDLIPSVGNKQITAKDALQVVNNFSYCTVCEQDRPEGTNCGKKDNCPW